MFCGHILNIQFPITAHGRSHHRLINNPRSALCFITLIKSLNLAGLPQYYILNIPITAHHQCPDLKPKSFQHPFAAHNVSPAVAGHGAGGEHTQSRPLIMMAASQAKLTSHISIPKQASVSAQACTGRQGC